MNQAEIQRNFSSHSLNDQKTVALEKIRAEGERFALLISELTRETPEQTTAIRCIEQALSWARSALERYPDAH